MSSYGDLEIPQKPNYWRFNGFEFIKNSNPEDIMYEVDPLTGLTQKPNEFGLIDSRGIFSKGVLLSTFKFKEQSVFYPTNVKRVTLEKLINFKDDAAFSKNGIKENEIDRKSRFLQIKAENGVNKGKYIDTPLFISNYNFRAGSSNVTIDESIATNKEYDLKPYANQLDLLEKLKNGKNLFNLIPSLKTSLVVDLPIKDIDWNVAINSPYYDYLKILHDPTYLTETKISSFSDIQEKNLIVPTDQKEFHKKTIERENSIDQNDYVFNIHIDESKLNYSQIETLKYVRENYPEEYDKLTRFVFSVNAKLAKNELASIVEDQKLKNDILKANFDSFNNFFKKFFINSTTKRSIIEIIFTWLSKQAGEHKKYFFEKISKYQKEFLATQLDKWKVKFNLQKSFTLLDNNSNVNFLISQKDDYKDDFDNASNINKLYITEGTKLKDSKQYLNLVKDLFKTYYLKSVDDIENDPYPEAKGKYLVNFINYFNKTDFFDDNFEKFDTAKEAIKDLLEYIKLGIIDRNKYNYLLGLFNPNYSLLAQKQDLTINTQGLNLLIYLNRGLNPISTETFLKINSPYSRAVIVTEKWLKTNNKEVLDPKKWQKALSLKSDLFLKWFDALDPKYKITINFKTFVILGVGQSAENAYPLVELDKKILNLKTDSLIYVNKLAYNAILSTAPNATESQYFSIKLNSNEEDKKQLRNLNFGVFSSFTKNKATLLSSDGSLLSLRFTWPQKINNYVKASALIFTLLLILIGVYLLILIIKIYVEKNQISLSIIKSNGFPTWKIVLSISTLGAFVGLMSGIIGYLLGYFSQSLFLNIISNYWVIPIKTHLFSVFDFSISVVAIYFFFLIFISILLVLLLKKPINELISRNTESRISKLLFLIKSSKFSLPIQSKFRLALSLNKIGKYFLFILISSFILSLLSIGISIPNKFKKSIENTENNRNYFYSFDLQSPTEQGGLYKTQNERFLGTTDEKNGILNIYKENILSRRDELENPYVTLWNKEPEIKENEPNKQNESSKRTESTQQNEANKQIKSNEQNQLGKQTESTQQNEIKNEIKIEEPKHLFALRNLDGSIRYYGSDKQIKYFTNFLLPSYRGYQEFSQNIDFLKNSVLVKWLIDFDIKIFLFNINAWDTVKNQLSSEVASRANSVSQNFVNEMMKIKEIKQLADIGNGTILNPKPFFKMTNGNLKLDFENVTTAIDLTDLDSLRFNDKFLKFIGVVYGEGYDKIKIKDSKISFGIIPENENLEKYTYLDTLITNTQIKLSPFYNNKKSSIFEIPTKIYGIKKDSKFVKILNNKNENIAHLLNKKIDDKYYPIIINNGAALKYNLKVNDTFESQIKNTYDRYSKKFYNQDFLKRVEFKVVGISSDSFNLSFYTSQEFANEILEISFDQGALIFKDYTRRRMTKWEDKRFENYELSAFGKKEFISDTSGKYNVVIDENIPENYVPFNGFFSDEKSSSTLINNQSFYSTIGFYGVFSNFYSDIFSKIAHETQPFVIFNKIIPFQNSRVIQLKDYLIFSRSSSYEWSNNTREEIVFSYSISYQQNDENLWNFLTLIFGDDNYVSQLILQTDAFNQNFVTFSEFFKTFLTVQNIIIGILLPILIMTILIISSVMITEFKKILAILKTLGYSDGKNLKSIFLTFIPVLVISLLIGILVMYFSIFAFQGIMFNATTIFLSTSLNWLPYVYGTIGIFLVILINFIYISIYLKKQNLKNAIN